MALFESSDAGIRLPAQGRNRFGPTSLSTFLKLEPRGPELVVCIVQVAPHSGRLMAELTPEEFLRRAGERGIDFGHFDDEDWLRLPPTSCRRAVKWLRERGFALTALPGARSRLSGLAERHALTSTA